MLLFPLYRCGNCSPERLVLLPQVTQLVSDSQSPQWCCILHRPGLLSCLTGKTQRGSVTSLSSQSRLVARLGG